MSQSMIVNKANFTLKATLNLPLANPSLQTQIDSNLKKHIKIK
jgi:hypothetical protein